MGQRKRIGVAMNMAAGYLHDVLSGIARAARTRPGWTLRVAGLFDDWIPRLLEWQPHGLLTCVAGQGVADLFHRRGIPVVCFSGSFPHSGLPTVHVDDRAVGRLAAGHFLDMNLKHFAFWAGHDAPFTVSRREGFFTALARAGVPRAHVHDGPVCDGGDWRRRDARLSEWLAGLPRPVGLLVSQDAQAYYISDIAGEAGLDIPNDIALLGVDNDPLVCNLTDPPLSSVRLPGRQVGAAAVRMLDAMLAGRPVQDGETLLEPLGVVRRGSTDMLAIDDDDMAAAVRYIRDNAADGLTVAKVLRKVPISRRSFECRFKSLFGRSPGEELRRVQLERARQLLLDTDSSMSEVAARAGFCDPEYMARIFKKELGVPPSRYRRIQREL